MVLNGDNMGDYMGVNKYIVVFWNKSQNDFEEVLEMFSLDEAGLQEAKAYTLQARKEYTDKVVRLLKETWQGTSFSDYETIRVGGK